MRMIEQQLDLARSIEFDKEQFLNDLIGSMHTTPEEFARLYILEEHPIDLVITETPKEVSYRMMQEFKVRRKTMEEQLEYELYGITQGVK